MKNLDKIKNLFQTGFFHIFGSSVINKIITFLSSIVLIHILTKIEYGAFTYAWNIYSIVLLFNGMGIESGVLQLASEHSGDEKYANKIGNYGARFGLCFNVLLLIILLLIGLFIPLKIEAGRKILCALCFLPFLQLIFNLSTTFLRAQKRNQEYAILQTLNTILVFVLSAVLSFIFREIGLIVGYYLAYTIALVIGFFFLHIRLIRKDTGSIGNDRLPLLKISVISMLNNGLSQLMYLLDVFVLGILDPQETILASYKVATIIPSALTFIPLSLVTYLYPYFAEHKDDGKWCIKKFKTIIICLGSLNLLISLILFFIAPYIIKVMYGEQYLDAVPVFRVLAFNYFFSGTFRILSGNLLVTQRKLKFNLFVAIVSSLTNIITDYLFIQWWGSMGAALATVVVVLISSILSTTYLIYTFRKKLMINEKNNTL